MLLYDLHARLHNKHSTVKMAAARINPKTTKYEFGGPVGTFFMTLGLPATVICLYVFCTESSCSVTALPTKLPSFTDFFHPLAFLVVIGWIAFQAILYLIPIGRVVKGSVIRNKTRLSYRLNGIHAFIISHIAFAVAYCVYKVPVRFMYDQFLPLATASILFSFILAVYLYTRSFRKDALLAIGGNSGSFVYDFFIGRELNPRIFSFDLKVFCELRPGLIGWTMINYCFLVAQYETFGRVSSSMVLVCVFQAWYVMDALIFEEAILTTMDIIHDGFGYMLAFGDLVWVPFTYNIQGRYLASRQIDFPYWVVALIVLLKLIGYAIFRGANSQKDLFRRNPGDPGLSHLKTLDTKRGTKLLISGWWGICRHPNYVGDLLMSVAWCLPCGFSTPIVYFYPIYFLVLLIHRQLRDEEQCQQKYGEDWDKYCKIVRWRLVPGIY